MDNVVNNRMRILYKSLNISLKDFCENVGIVESTTRNMFNRGTNPSFDVIEKIANAYPDISLDWLITGKGEMLKSTNTPHTNNPDKRIKELELTIIQKDAEIRSLKDTIEMLIQTIKK